MGIKISALASVLAIGLGATAQAQDSGLGSGSALYVLSSPSDRVSLGGAGLAFNERLSSRSLSMQLPAIADFRLGLAASPGFGVGVKIASIYRADVSLVGLDSFGLSGYPSLSNQFSVAQRPSAGAALFSGYIDLEKLDALFLGKARAYVGGSVGYAYGLGGLAGGDAYADASRANVAWGIGAGVGYDVSPKLRLGASYRYLETGRVGPVFGFAKEPYALRGYSLRLGVVKVFD